MYRVRNLLPDTVVSSLYFSLVHPYILYAIISWYGAPSYLSNKVKIYQKRAVRIAKSLDFNGHTLDSFVNMKLLPVDSLFSYRIAVHMFCTINFPGLDSNLLEKLVSLQSQHNYPTRNGKNFVIPRCRRETTKRCLHISGVRVWSSIPAEVKECNNYKQFKIKMKNFLICNIT